MFILWAALVAFAVFLAPGKGGMEDEIMMQLLSGSFENVDPLIVMVFSFLGIFPMVFALLLLPKDTDKLPAWPFVMGSFALGAFSLLPYFFLRKKTVRAHNRNSLKVTGLRDSKFVLGLLALITLCLYGYGLSLGSSETYKQAFMSSRLVSVMTVDFLVLTWLSWYVLKHEYQAEKMALYSFIPVIGPLFVLLRGTSKKEE